MNDQEPIEMADAAPATAAVENPPVAEPVATPKITIDDFMKVEVSVGTILVAEPVPESAKLLRLEVSFGSETRQIVSGIAKYVPNPEDLVGKQLPFVTNPAPRKMAGLESDGMLFAVGEGESFAFLTPDRKVPPGTKAH